MIKKNINSTLETMKKNVLKYYILTLCLFSNLIIFSQDLGPGESGNGAGGGPEGVAAPINNFLWVLLILGFSFAFYKFKSFLNQNKI